MKKVVVILTVFFVLLQGNVFIIEAKDNYESILDEVVEKTGLPVSSVEKDIEDIAKKQKISKFDAANLLLDEVSSGIDYVENKEISKLRSSSSSGSSVQVKLPKSAVGDIYYSPGSVGHVGMYYTENSIVEGPGAGKKVWLKNISKLRTNKYSLILGVSKTKIVSNPKRMPYNIRKSAVNWAYSKKGRSYAYTLSNKVCGANDYNCSQLAWCAFKQKAKIDLDSNGGFFVSPANIKYSPYTYVVKSLEN